MNKGDTEPSIHCTVVGNRIYKPCIVLPCQLADRPYGNYLAHLNIYFQIKEAK